MRRTFFAVVFSFALVSSLNIHSARALELLLFESDSCEWCELRHKQIGVIYSKTEEGKQAPLRTVDVFEKAPKDIAHIKQGRYTPTFVLVDKGVEIGRIRGYPGEDFFWGMLDELLKKAKKMAAKKAS